MAGGVASSSSSAALFSSSDLRQNDVFVSFRGKDIRRDFLSHLRYAFDQNHIRAYIDDQTGKGQKVWPALVHAIENSYLCIVIFSKNYASSTWCLKEVTHILESKEDGEVIPVFYKVNPSVVRTQTASYDEAFQKHEKDYKLEEGTVEKWRDSLDKAAGFSGFNRKDYGDENQLIQTIVKDILHKLESVYPKSEAQGLVGIDENCACIEASLKQFQSIALWGMSGIGKTTLARCVFDKYRSRYQGHCFLANIMERSRNRHDLYELRNELFSELLEKGCSRISDFDKSRLKRIDVLVVLDDVDTEEQIEFLVGDQHCFGAHSKIIITTRNRHVLRSREAAGVYEVKTLTFEDSLKLFSLKAFGKDHPQIGFEMLSERAIIHAEGIPLVLKILGLFLRGRSEKFWESELKKLKERPQKEIQDALKLSYDGLDCEVQKILLDMAFFFKGHKKDEIESFYSATISEMEILSDMAFITINSDGDTVEMHDLIQKFLWNIVHQECEDPRGRSRLRDAEEIYVVLKNNEGSDKVQGMILDLSQLPDLHLSAATFKRMPNLRLLKFSCHNLWFGKACKLYTSGLFGVFSHRHWHAPGECQSSIPCFKKHADERHIPDIHVSKLEEEVQYVRDLVNWKKTRKRSRGSMETISYSSNPEWVRPGCTNLCHFQPSMLSFHMIVKTDISWIVKLKNPRDEIPSTSVPLGNTFSEGCSRVKQFLIKSVEIRGLDVTDTSVKISSGSGQCFINVEQLFLHDFFKNFRNECGQQISPELLQISTIRQLDMLNSRHIRDALRSIEGLLFCKSCELSHTPLDTLNSRHIRDPFELELPALQDRHTPLDTLKLCPMPFLFNWDDAILMDDLLPDFPPFTTAEFDLPSGEPFFYGYRHIPLDETFDWEVVLWYYSLPA